MTNTTGNDSLRVNDATPAESADVEDGKNLTFRKRRLSLPLHHLSATDATAAEAQSTPPNDVGVGVAAAAVSEEYCDPAAGDEIQKLGYGEAPPSESPAADACLDDSEEGKALTFRKRRLSLTASTLDSESPEGKRNRRASIDSIASSVASNERKFVSRTLHSGELMGAGVPPPSPAGPNGNSFLYQQQQHSSPMSPPDLDLGSASPRLQHQPLLPKWKRRHTLNLSTELHKLPFSRDVVGTYSCHGAEPVYGSEYDEEPAAIAAGEEEDQAGFSPPKTIQTFLDANTPDNMPHVYHTTLLDDTTNDSKQAVVSVEAQKEAPPTTVAKINQDRGGVAFPYGNCPRTALFAVYDGHGQGGELVSQYALHEIQRRLEKHRSFPTDLERAFKDTFLAVDNALRHEPLVDPLFAGTTACVALLQDRTLTLANAGDSRAVCARKLSNGNFLALELTADQNPDVPEEMERILSCGGYVTLPPAPGLSARVWLDPMCTQIGLAMARSIGDHAVGTVGVIAEPVVTTHEITAQDDFLILASDGVWEFLESVEAVSIVAANLHRGATKACQALIEAAAAKWHIEEGAYRDDITAIVVRLQDLWKDANTSGRKDYVASTKTSPGV